MKREDAEYLNQLHAEWVEQGKDVEIRAGAVSVLLRMLDSSHNQDRVVQSCLIKSVCLLSKDHQGNPVLENAYGEYGYEITKPTPPAEQRSQDLTNAIADMAFGSQESKTPKGSFVDTAKTIVYTDNPKSKRGRKPKTKPS